MTALCALAAVIVVLSLTAASCSAGDADSRSNVPSPAEAMRRTGDIIWENVVHLDEKIVIPADKSLVIRPGTQVKITGGGNTFITVEGELFAEGTEEQQIAFVPAKPDYWGGIRFEGKRAGGVLKYCRLVNGQKSFPDDSKQHLCQKFHLLQRSRL